MPLRVRSVGPCTSLLGCLVLHVALTTMATEHYGIIKSVQYTGKGESLATISRQTDSSVYFLDPLSGAVTRRFQQHDLCGADVSVSPDGRYLATTSDDASVRIWVLGE